MPHAIRPGDVLADRYRLVDLLVDAGGARFWRAHDKVLERHVAVHVIAADDERAPGLVAAARRSATVPDRRMLRVLDADMTPDLCYVVNEWGSGTSLDIWLPSRGPMTARHAAWVVGEVAQSLSVAHAAGVPHGRLVPENVLVDRHGGVRIIGFAVDAALHGVAAPGHGDDAATARDVRDIAGLLYAALTGRWAGASSSAVTVAPLDHGRVLRPRQVRAGIPRPLDAVCDEVLNGAAARTHDLPDHTARTIAAILRDFVGDPLGIPEALAALNPSTARVEPVVLPPLVERPAPVDEPSSPPVVPPPSPPSPAPAPHAPDAEVVETADPQPSRQVREQPEPEQQPEAVERPTEAGVPIFDDEDDEVSWLTTRASPPPPPPPFEEPPERPLFAPDGPGGPARRPPATARKGNPEFWPWDTSTSTGTGTPAVAPDRDVTEEHDGDAGRRWLLLAAVLALGVIILLASVVAYNLGRGRTPLGGEPTDEPTPSQDRSGAEARPITGVSARDLDPQGDPAEENPELAPLAVDGDPATAWRTMTYEQDLGPGGLKTGLGLVLDLGEVREVATVDLVMVGQPTDVALYLTDDDPTGVAGLESLVADTVGTRQRITLDEPASGRYLVVWLTSLPAVSDGFRGEIAEVTVRG